MRILSGEPRKDDRDNAFCSQPRPWFKAWYLIVAVVVALLSVSDPTSATISPPGCLSNDYQLDLGKNMNVVHVGDVITYTISDGNPNTSGVGCDVQINTITLTLPDGTTTGNQVACTGSLTIGTPTSACATVSYTVKAGDPQALTATVNGIGCLHDSDAATTPPCASPANPGDDNLSASKQVTVTLLEPEISVTKTCVDAVFGSPIPFSGSVTNPSTTTGLVNVQCTDSIAGQVTLNFPGSPGVLNPGESATYSSSYTPVTNPSTDTVTCTGQDATGLTIQGTASATCSVLCSPAIEVTKQCTDAPLGQPINFSGTVANTGNVPLTVSCTEDKGTATGFPSSLAPGANASYSGSYTPTSSPSTDTVSCTGTPPAICNLPPVTNQASATCNTTCSPAFDVTKTCTDASGPGQPIDYTGTVSNTGNADLNCTIADNQSTPTPTSATITAGGSQDYNGSYVPISTPSTDTVTVVCTPADTALCGNSPITHTASATCTVPTISTTPKPSTGELGVLLNDTVTLTGTIPAGSTVTFQLFPPDDPNCDNPTTDLTQAGVPVVNNTASTSPGFAATAVGTWHWTVFVDQNPDLISRCTEPVIITGPVIPTLSEWGMLIMVAVLVGTGFMRLRRRRGGVA
jgi:hypothetical protein